MTPPPPSERLWARVDTSGGQDACWPWTGGTVRGYGQVSIGRRRFYTHRLAWELTHGPLPDGAHVDHVCHNGTDCRGGDACPHRRCCNPAHLEPTTPADNLGRSQNWTGNRTRCARAGHPLSGTNVYVDRHGGRSCWECRREAGRRHDRKRRAAGRR